MIKLRELCKDDLQYINKWRNDKDLIDYVVAPFRYINIDVDNIWFNNYMNHRDVNVRCAIVETEKECEILGQIGLLNISHLNQSASFFIMIGNPGNRSKGIGFLASKQMLFHGFNNLNLNRIELNVLENNSMAISLYKKLGFKVEGLKRNAIYKNGEFVNLIVMSILRSEFHESNIENEN